MTSKPLPPEIQKIREALVEIICFVCFPYKCAYCDLPTKERLMKCKALADTIDQICSELDKLGVVVLAPDQTPPELKPGMFPQIGAGAGDGYRQGIRDYQKAGAKQVVSIVTGTPKEG